MASNRLELNADKMEFISLGTCQQLVKINTSPLQLQDQTLMSFDKVRDLGVILDSTLTMEACVANVVHSCFYQLRQLRSIRRSLTVDARRTLVTVFVANRVDNCNAVVYFDCVRGTGPAYFSMVSLTDISGRSGLRSAVRGDHS